MARQLIEIGLQGNDGTGDSIREAFRKVNDNFRDLYAVFGKGGQIAFTDLDDAPATYTANQVLITDTAGSSIVTRTLTQGSGITIVNDAQTGVLSIGLSNGGLADAAPSLVGPLNGNGLPIAKIAEPSLDAVASWNIAHEASGVSINIDDIVITKGYADKRYLLGGSTIPIRVRAEPVDTTEYVKQITGYQTNGNAIVVAHGFTEASNGFKVTFNSTDVAPTPLVNGTAYFLRFYSVDELSVHPTEADAKSGTNKIIISNDGTGTHTFTDFYFDPLLAGNWLSNEALPRSQTVRRTGDTMTGALFLSGAPTDNLHAATKAYVDSTSVSGARQSISISNLNSASGSAYLDYNNTTGVITFHDSLVSEETSEPQGFPNKLDSKISFDAITRTFTIQPTNVGGTFVCWCKGVRHEYTSAQTVQITDATGLYYIYFDTDGVLSVKTTHFNFETDSPVSYVYWNATANTAPFIADERHGSAMSWSVHAYLHRTRGAVFASGFSVSYSLGSGNADSDAQIDLTSGTFFDEDMEIAITHSNAPIANTFQQDLQGPGQIPVFRMFGDSEWYLDTPTDFPMKQGVSGVEYNKLDAGTWSTEPITSGKFGISWVVATNNITYPVFAILGQAEYATSGAAEAVTWGEMTLPNFPLYECRPLYKVIYEADATYTNTVKAKIVSVWDLRGITSTTITAAIVADHGLLSGLADDDHGQYVHTSIARTISANHTFTGNVTFSNTVNLPDSGITAGTYTKVTFNADGIATTGASATTSDIAEGTNLYFTNERVDDRVAGLLAAGNNISLSYNDNTNVLTISASGNGQGGFNLNNNTTDDLTEGSVNLYYTDTRARSAISVSGSLSYNSTSGVISYTTPSTIASLSNHTTDGLTEGSSNLYFTTARVRSSISAGTGLSYNSTSGIISNTITQYTDTMARSAISAGSGISYDNSTGVISAVGTTTATANTIVSRDANADINASKFHGATVSPVQIYTLDSTGLTLTASTITSNIITCDPQVDSFIQLPSAGAQPPNAVVGYRIIIRNRNLTHGITINEVSTTITILGPNSAIELACDGYNWFTI